MRFVSALAVAVAGLAIGGAALASTSPRTTVEFQTAPQAVGNPQTTINGLEINGRTVVFTSLGRFVMHVMGEDGHPYVLDIVPATEGFCRFFAGPDGDFACFSAKATPQVVPASPPVPTAPLLVDGTVFGSSGVRLVVGFQDGRHTVIPFIWVTTPINAGFYFYRLTASERRPGHRPTTISLYNKSGGQLCSVKLPRG